MLKIELVDMLMKKLPRSNIKTQKQLMRCTKSHLRYLLGLSTSNIPQEEWDALPE